MIDKTNSSLPPIPPRPADLPAGQWTEAALRVLRERYLLKDPRGAVIETPEELCWRVAWTIAQAERAWDAHEGRIQTLARAFYGLMVRRELLPNSPTLMNAGKGRRLTLAGCYVLPIEDSIPGIFGTLGKAALIQQAGGGVGFAFSRLRPKGSRVRSSGGTSSGPISFLREAYDHMTDAVKQGSTRRGANMGILRSDHPDLLEFIDAKRSGGISNFNISVAVTDEFMAALDADASYPLRARAGWPRPDGSDFQDGEPYWNPATGHPLALRAREVWDRLCRAAWATGDPGLFFIDRTNRWRANPVPSRYQVESTNPCGEQPLYPNDQCTLGSINLAAFTDTASRKFDWDRLGAAVGLATRFLDDVLEASPPPTPEVGEMVRAIRRIGLGVMGWADALIRLGLPYDSEEAVALAGRVMRSITETAEQTSVELARVRGAFPLWPESIWRDGPPRRNSTVTTIAPTGTISILAGCSSGIEPLYAVAFTHTVRRPEGDRVLPIMNPLFESLARAHGIYSERLMEAVTRRGIVRGLPDVPEDLQRLFGTAHEIDLAWHVRHQAAFQAWTHNGVSKSVNLPHSATVEDVSRAYRLAWDLGCLGITVFRDGCKGEQVLTVGTTPTPASAPAPAPAAAAPGAPGGTATESAPVADTPLVRPRPPRLEGPTFKVETPLGTAYVTVTLQDGEPLEVFVNVGKSGTDTGAFAEALGRLVSTLLRLERLPGRTDRAREVIDQLSQIGGSRDVGYGPKRIRSVPDAIAWALGQALQPAPDLRQLALPASVTASGNNPAPHRLGDLCPTCGAAAVVWEEGCRHCLACGLYSEC